MSRWGVGKEMRKYGGHPEISYRKLSEASGVSANTIMQYVRLLEAMEEDEWWLNILFNSITMLFCWWFDNRLLFFPMEE